MNYNEWIRLTPEHTPKNLWHPPMKPPDCRWYQECWLGSGNRYDHVFDPEKCHWYQSGTMDGVSSEKWYIEWSLHFTALRF